MVDSIKITLGNFAIIWTIAAIFSCSWSIYHHNESVHQAAFPAIKKIGMDGFKPPPFPAAETVGTLYQTELHPGIAI